MARTPQDILDRIRQLEREVRELRGRSQTRPAMNQVNHGDVQIGEGGSLAVYPPGQATASFAVGYWGGEEYGAALRRQTGEDALTIVNGDGQADSKQPLRLFDTYGHELWSDDIANWGMARPYIPVPVYSGRDISGSSWQTTHIGRWYVQHPRLYAEFSVYCGSGTAEAGLFLDDGSGLVQLGSSISSSGTEEFATLDLYPPDHGQVFGATPTLFLRGRVTSGSGTATVWCRGFQGFQS